MIISRYSFARRVHFNPCSPTCPPLIHTGVKLPNGLEKKPGFSILGKMVFSPPSPRVKQTYLIIFSPSRSFLRKTSEYVRNELPNALNRQSCQTSSKTKLDRNIIIAADLVLRGVFKAAALVLRNPSSL